jgi:hypothetical protein
MEAGLFPVWRWVFGIDLAAGAHTDKGWTQHKEDKEQGNQQITHKYALDELRTGGGRSL